MRRIRTLLTVVAVTSLFAAWFGPSAQAANHIDIQTVITGSTRTHVPTTPQVRDVHQGEFEGVAIAVNARTPDEHIVGTVRQPVGHKVVFTADDDLHDASGTISATDDTRAFRSADGVEVRTDDPVPVPACAEVRVLGGSFQRTGAVVNVTVRLDSRVERDEDGNCATPGTEVLEITDCSLTIVFVVTPDPVNPLPPGDELRLVGVGATHC